jgi:taurine dioxygenase
MGREPSVSGGPRDTWPAMTGALGAFAPPGDARDLPVAEILQALNAHQVVAFRNQALDPAALVAFAAQLGELDVYPLAEPLPESPYLVAVLKNPEDESNFGGAWHTDTSYVREPPKFTVLYAVEIPARGGDTMFADMYQAFAGLSPGLQRCLEGMRAVYTADLVHGGTGEYTAVAGQSVPAKESQRTTTVEHPVVRVHPETGRKALYTSLIHTQRFVGMTREESLPLLTYLQGVSVAAENCTRLAWQPGTLAIWDNRCVQHYPLNDYPGERRLMHRAIVKGEEPLGVEPV